MKLYIFKAQKLGQSINCPITIPKYKFYLVKTHKIGVKFILRCDCGLIENKKITTAVNSFADELFKLFESKKEK